MLALVKAFLEAPIVDEREKPEARGPKSEAPVADLH